MSINITVNGNPVSMRNGKMVLSDLENIKKTEREHRKRLRLEQVHEQSKAVAKKLLQRARQKEQEQLKLLEQDRNTEMRRAHERKLWELQRRLQDTDNIGYAHEKAKKQPDVEAIKKAEEERNKAIAEARGVEAIHRLQEANKTVSPHSKQQQVLRKVRETEKLRSQMVSQLPKKDQLLDISENENIKSTPATSSRKTVKHVIPKKSPVRKVSKTKKTLLKHTKTPSHVSVSVANEETSKTPTTATSSTEENKSCPYKKPKTPQTVADTIKKRNTVCESDENEPRKTVPVTTPSTPSSKAEKFIRCQPQDSEESSTSSLSSSSTTTSSSISDDSSYYSESNSKTTVVRKTPKCTSTGGSKVSLYDHGTRHKNTYSTPSGMTERLNIKNKPNANELAQQIIQLEKEELEAILNQKENIKKRSEDACLREKVRRDYQALLKRLQQLSNIERRAQAKQVPSSSQIPPPTKQCEDLARQQKKMDRAFENILRSSRDPGPCDNRAERPITITPRDYIHSNTTPTTAWNESSYTDGQESVESYSEEDSDFTRKRKISELIIKLEKMKRRLLNEYGADLPDEIFKASVRSLFQQSSTLLQPDKVERETPKPPAPEIQVINMSSDETAKARKVTSTVKRTSSNQTYQSTVASSVKRLCNKNNQSTGTNRHKRCLTPGKNLLKPSAENTLSTRDQQVQVELEAEKSKQEIPRHPLEPVVNVIAPENVESCSSISSSNTSTATDLVIDVSRTEVTVFPKQGERSVKISKDCKVISSVRTMQYSSGKAPVKISLEQKSATGSIKIARVVIDADTKEVTVIPTTENVSPIISGKSHSLPGSRLNSPVKKNSRSAPPSRHSSPKESYAQTHQPPAFEQKQTTVEEKRYRTQYTQVSIDSSTESSQFNSTSDTTNGRVFTRFEAQRIVTKMQDTSDTSTAYMSPPAATPGAFLRTMINTTPILEFLDPSCNETIKQKMADMSPVSSPETPSPRTMMIPSNIPRGDQVGRRKLDLMSLIDRYSRRSAAKNASPGAQHRQAAAKDKSKITKSPSKAQSRVPSQGRSQAQSQTQGRSQVQNQGQGRSHVQNHGQGRSQVQKQGQGRSQVQSQDQGRSEDRRQDQGRRQIQSQRQDQGQVQSQRQDQGQVQSQRQDQGQVQNQRADRSQAQSQDHPAASQIQIQNQDQSQSQTPKSSLDQHEIQNQSKKCTCKNPGCKLIHDRIDDAQSYTLKYCPKILKKYENLQNVYTERIASLTDMIQKVRNEQKELSVMTTEDSNSINQATSSGQPSANSAGGTLVENIEAIYAKLKRTLTDSEKIITGDEVELPHPSIPYEEVDKSESTISKDSQTTDSLDETADKVKPVETTVVTDVSSTKPRIINDERVHIKLDRFVSGRPSRKAENEKTEGDVATTTTGTATVAQASTADTATNVPDQNEEIVQRLQMEILEQSKSLNKSAPVDSLKDSDDSLLKSSQAPAKESGDSSKNAASYDENHQSINLDNSDFIPLLAGIPKVTRTSTKNSTNGRARPPVTLISGPYRPDIDSPVHELSTIVEFDTPDTANKSQMSTRSPSNKCRKRLPTGDVPQPTTSSPTKGDTKFTKRKPSVQVHSLPVTQASLNLSSKSSKSIENSPKKSLEKLPKKSLEKSPKKSLDKSSIKSLEKSSIQILEKLSIKSLEKSSIKSFQKSPRKSLEKSPRKSLERSKESLEKNSLLEPTKSEFSDSMLTLPDIHVEHLHQSHEITDVNYDFRISQISDLHSLPDENIEQMLISEICEESKSKSVTPVQKPPSYRGEPEQDRGHLTSTSSASISGLSGVSEITTTPSSDINMVKCPSSPEEMEQALKKMGLAWAFTTLKKTREASALGSSSSSDVTPVNTAAARLVSPMKKQQQEVTPRNLPEISDVSSISIQHANKSTERSVLVKGRTSTPNRLSNSSNSNSDGTVSTLGSFSSELNIVVQNESAEITIPNISFTNNKLG